METIRKTLQWNVFWHRMNVPRKERFAYYNEIKNGCFFGRDDTGKHKDKMITFQNWKTKYKPVVYYNEKDRLI